MRSDSICPYLRFGAACLLTIASALVAPTVARGAVCDRLFSSGMEELAMTAGDASRFLAQATFGPTSQAITTLRSYGYESWLNQQACTEPTLMTDAVQAQQGTAQLLPVRLRRSWEQFLFAEDQLRQRVAFTLSEIMVVSQLGYECSACPIGMARYYDTIVEHALGNYRDLLEAITLNPAMGFYLSMLSNARADPVANTRADENFAREIMQLFSIGLVMLGPDGEPLSNGQGNPIPTYDIDHIKGLARAFTGWTWAGTPSWFFPDANQLDPMAPYREGGVAIYHDDEAKDIVGPDGVASATPIPAALAPEDDLEAALDTIFNHPNVPPFIGKQLIQKLVTSNPTPAYVTRISAVFEDDGNGVRGNLAAVVRAILLDPEARDSAAAADPSFGKLREPILRLTHLWRAFGAQFDVGGAANNWIFLGLQLGQSPLQAPSVFNFFRPDHVANVIDDPDLVAPEFQINTESNLVSYQNLLRELTIAGFSGAATTTFYHVVMNGDAIRAPLLQSPAAFVDQLDLLFFGDAMSESMRGAMLTLIARYDTENGAFATLDPANQTLRAAVLIYVALTSPEYLVQR